MSSFPTDELHHFSRGLLHHQPDAKMPTIPSHFWPCNGPWFNSPNSHEQFSWVHGMKWQNHPKKA
jgi:hypothetical protein